MWVTVVDTVRQAVFPSGEGVFGRRRGQSHVWWSTASYRRHQGHGSQRGFVEDGDPSELQGNQALLLQCAQCPVDRLAREAGKVPKLFLAECELAGAWPEKPAQIQGYALFG